MDDRGFEQALHRRAVRFGWVLLLGGSALTAWTLYWALSDSAWPAEVGLAPIVFGLPAVFDGARRVWIGKAPKDSDFFMDDPYDMNPPD